MPECDGNVSDEYELVDSGSEWHEDDILIDEDHGPFSCKVCSSILRDNVECSSCHSLFCREHLRINKAAGTSPCPCKPCAFSAVPQPLSFFLPNIPVQRMADSIPSRCDGCGGAFSWGDLAKHACERQTINCEYASWGCSWKGQRQHLPRHLASSTCPGKLALAEHEVAEARKEINTIRMELAAAKEAKEDAERRAVTAETRSRELEAKVAEAEKNLREKDAVIAKRATADNLNLAAGERRTSPAAANNAASGTGGRNSGGTSSSPSASESSSGQTTRNQSATTAIGIQQQLLGVMFNQKGDSSKPQQAAGASSSTGKTSSGQQKKQNPMDSTRRQSDESAAPASGTALASPAVVAVPRPVGVDVACQAPVPATEACLKPYLERPHALLEKKIVVFWPR